MSTAVISGSNPTPILETAEEAFDVVTLTIENLIVCDQGFTVTARRDAWFGALKTQSLTEPVAIVPTISQHVVNC